MANKTDKELLKEYFLDQISYYEKRAKTLRNNNKNKEKVGLPVTALDKVKLLYEENHIDEFKLALEGLNSMQDNEFSLQNYYTSLKAVIENFG